MEKNFDSEPAENVTREELTSVMTALEPDQIISAKEHHHCPRRRANADRDDSFLGRCGFIWCLWLAWSFIRFGRAVRGDRDRSLLRPQPGPKPITL